MRPLRAFPFPLNVGTDICQISRIHGILRSPRGTRFVRRVLAPEEQQGVARSLLQGFDAQTGGKVGDGSVNDARLWKSAVFIAGRFAAKEAAIKAHSHRRLTFHDIIIERRGRDEDRLGSGPPIARIRGVDGDKEDMSAVVSISHDGDYATAVCMGYDPSLSAGHQRSG